MKQLRSLVRRESAGAAGALYLELHDVPPPTPGPAQLLVRVEAAPINPSDIGLLLAGANTSGGRTEQGDSGRRYTAPIAASLMEHLQPRLEQAVPCGLEGMGTVVATGNGPRATAMMNRRVAFLSSGSYADCCLADVENSLPLPDDVSATEAASSFVNPLTALGMVETMRSQGHAALVHTAAASSLGHMLVRICQMDGIELVNVVRSAEGAASLRQAGARHVVDSSAADFTDRLVESIAATGATLAFDAVGGGTLAGQILTAMEAALSRRGSAGGTYSRYGSAVHKQVYVYGRLSKDPIQVSRSNGMTAWGVGGWLLRTFLDSIGTARSEELKARVAAELKTTFRSSYSRTIELHEMLEASCVDEYSRLRTGTKFLVRVGPHTS